MGGVYFMSISNKIAELKKLREEVPKEAERIAIKFKEEILDYIREKQLFEKGIDGNGNLLREYKPFTVAIKKSKGEVYNRTTLLDSGSFYKLMDLKFTDQYSIGVFSRDAKTPELIEKYGQDIFTFTVSNQKEINEQIFIKNLVKWLLNTRTFTQI